LGTVANIAVAKPLLHTRIVVSDTLTVLRPMLPIIATQRIYSWPINIDVVVVPIEVAAPIISARCPIAERPSGTECKTGRDKSTRDISGIAKIIWRVFWIGPPTIDNARIVIRNVERLRVRRLNGNQLLSLFLSLRNSLLFCRGQLVVRVSL
jgi:hypothetical protein